MASDFRLALESCGGGGARNLGTLFGGPFKGFYSIWGVKAGTHIFGKYPHRPPWHWTSSDIHAERPLFAHILTMTAAISYSARRCALLFKCLVLLMPVSAFSVLP